MGEVRKGSMLLDQSWIMHVAVCPSHLGFFPPGTLGVVVVFSSLFFFALPGVLSRTPVFLPLAQMSLILTFHFTPQQVCALYRWCHHFVDLCSLAEWRAPGTGDLTPHPWEETSMKLSPLSKPDRLLSGTVLLPQYCAQCRVQCYHQYCTSTV